MRYCPACLDLWASFANADRKMHPDCLKELRSLESEHPDKTLKVLP